MVEGTRIVIAEDHPFFCDGLRRALKQKPSLQIIGEGTDGLTALEKIRALKPDLAILDISLPGMDGVALVRQIRKEQIPVEIIFLTICDNEDIFEEALKLGVKGYLLKDCTEAELLRCVSAVTSGQHYASPSMTTYLVNRARRTERFARQTPGLDLLTPHERSILSQIADGKTSKEIAHELGIASKTVDAHRTNICNKLEIHGQYALSRFASRHRSEL